MRSKNWMAVLLAVLLIPALGGCALARLDAAEDALEAHADRAEDALEQALRPTGGDAPTAFLTPEQAQAIALADAGFTADQVSYLRAEYDVDDGRPRYEVQFRQDRWEYDYEIDAETGNILSYDRDD